MTAKDDRAARLAAQLRANLRRRKAGTGPGDAAAPDRPGPDRREGPDQHGDAVPGPR